MQSQSLPVPSIAVSIMHDQLSPVVQAIDQICGFLGIHCLTIPGPEDGAVEKEIAAGSRGREGDAKDL